MSEVATIPEVAVQNKRWPDPPRLLVQWSSPWEEFKTAIRPAMRRSTKPLAGEAPVGMFPYRGLLLAWFAEFLLILIVVILPAHIASLQPFTPPPRPTWDVVYYTGAELPQTADTGGAQSGKSGRAGGQEARHRTQAIRVARGDKPAETVVDAPKVNLPHSDSAVANLIAFKANPGPPPTEGMRSRQSAPLAPAVVAPAPDVQSSSRTQSNLNPSIVAPAPDVRVKARNTPQMNPTLVAPTPDVARDRIRSTTPLETTVVAAPQETPRDLASSRTPVSQAVNVVAPPVSAPARDASAPKLALPEQAVVAPPPSQVSRELNSWGATHSGEIHSQPVPPPPSASAGAGSLARNGAGALSSQVVPPPASVGGLGSAGGNGSGGRNAQLGSAAVVPPPPGLGGGQALAGNGRGSKGSGGGGPLDLGSSVAPPASAGGNSAGNGVIMSSQPGTKVGVPNSTSGGAIAMSPSGTAKTGLGGSGGGASIGRGPGGPGSGLAGEGPGAGKEGAGHGSDPNARGGISPYPGPGGAGTGSNSPAMAGVSVQGGTTTVSLPSFGDPGGDVSGNGPGRSSTDIHRGSGITIEATPRSGGVFAYYGVLKGDRNYSIYIDTAIGNAVMQYSDPASALHPTRDALAAPEPMRKELPAALHPTRIVFTCIIDREGMLKDIKVLDQGNANTETRARILVALQSWKFRPAFRGNDPVEVDAILGFGVDTR